MKRRSFFKAATALLLAPLGFKAKSDPGGFLVPPHLAGPLVSEWRRLSSATLVGNVASITYVDAAGRTVTHIWKRKTE